MTIRNPRKTLYQAIHNPHFSESTETKKSNKIKQSEPQNTTQTYKQLLFITSNPKSKLLIAMCPHIDSEFDQKIYTKREREREAPYQQRGEGEKSTESEEVTRGDRHFYAAKERERVRERGVAKRVSAFASNKKCRNGLTTGDANGSGSGGAPAPICSKWVVNEKNKQNLAEN